ncbi:carotenoid biosynthesis protein [bacterium]|nr:carotenoid biosynthesis protein [bacterium]
MDAISILMVVTGSVVILLMIGDRLTQEFGIKVGRWYAPLQLFSGLAGVIIHSLLTGGLRWTLTFGILSMFIPYLIEIVGHRSGFPFGRYRYLPDAGPTLPGGVPVGVVIMWWMILYASTIVALACIEVFSMTSTIWLIAALTSLFAMGWDLVADPVAVDGKFWEWKKQGVWLGIPLSNYFGWLLTGIITMVIALPLAGEMEGMELRLKWIVFLPLLGYAGLHLHYAGAAAKRKLSPLASWTSIIQAVGLIILYVVVLRG